MASTSKGCKLSKALLDQLRAVTGMPKDTAKQLLQMCEGDVQMAINFFLEDREAGAGPSTAMPVPPPPPPPLPQPSSVLQAASTSAGLESSSTSHVRDPIPPTQGVLVEASEFNSYAPRYRRMHSVFDSFRDFQVEARRQEEILTGGEVSQKRKSLEDLFRPPLDLVIHGTFQDARDTGIARKRWLMVNVQNVMEFCCQVLNRDIWSNKAIRTIIKEQFVLWQVYSDSMEGHRYSAFYNVSEWPYVAIIDPRTGECMQVWTKIECTSFCDSLFDFLCQHPYEEQPTTKRIKLSPEDAEKAAENGNSNDTNEAMEGNTESTESEASSLLATSNDPEAKTKSILDAGEAEQLAAAIQASLTETLVNGDTADEFIANKSTDEDSNDDESNAGKSVAPSAAKSVAPSAPEPNGGTEEISEPDDLETNRLHLGGGDEKETKFMLRYPDGNRELYLMPSSAPIKELWLHVAEKGFPLEQYELIKNFPRRVLSALEGLTPINTLGLHQQETVFVELR